MRTTLERATFIPRRVRGRVTSSSPASTSIGRPASTVSWTSSSPIAGPSHAPSGVADGSTTARDAGARYHRGCYTAFIISEHGGNPGLVRSAHGWGGARHRAGYARADRRARWTGAVAV